MKMREHRPVQLRLPIAEIEAPEAVALDDRERREDLLEQGIVFDGLAILETLDDQIVAHGRLHSKNVC